LHQALLAWLVVIRLQFAWLHSCNLSHWSTACK